MLGTVTTYVWRQPCRSYNAGWGGSNEDHFVEEVMLGTAITRFPLPAESAPAALPVLRLSRRPAARGRARQIVIDPFTHRRGN